MDVIIRTAEEDEIPGILAMQKEIFSGEQNIPADLIGAVMEDNPRFWCAELDGKIVGAITAWEEDGQVHLGRFVVTPGLRGKHIGRQLLKAGFDGIFADGTEIVYMEARDVSVRLVSALGGIVTGAPREFYLGTVTPMIMNRADYHGFCPEENNRAENG